MIFFYLGYLALLVFYLSIRKCCRYQSCSKRIIRYLKPILCFDWILTVIIESYSLVSISCLIQASKINFTASTGITLHSAVCITFVVFFLVMPYWLLLRLSMSINNLKEKKALRILY